MRKLYDSPRDKRKRSRSRNAPKPLPPRSRSLTAPLNPSPLTKPSLLRALFDPRVLFYRSPKSKDQTTFEQTQSTLLTKLPFDVRRLIWRFVIGNRHLHTVRCRSRLSYRKCLVEGPVQGDSIRYTQRGEPHLLCWDGNGNFGRGQKPPGIQPVPVSAPDHSSLMALLKKCRVM